MGVQPDQFSQVDEFDVLVVGAGAGGLAAAVTAAHRGLRVAVLERAPVCGGASAWSGGWMWAPGNPLAEADGVHDELETVRDYLRAALKDNYEPERVDAFLEAAPAMIAFFHEETHLQFVPGAAICDIYGDLPGAGTGHRSVAPAPVDMRELGPAVAALLQRQLYETSFLGMGIMAGPDLASFLAASRGNVKGLAHAARRTTRHFADLARYRRGQQLVNGTALIGRLLRSALNKGVDIHVSTKVTALIKEAGRIAGVELSDGRKIRASRGVVLATGGFSRNEARVRETFPRGEKHWSLAPRTADGAGLALAESVGGRLRTDLASPAAWCPVSLFPYRSGRIGVFPHIMDRAKPGSIGVLRTGQRFVNEANGYYDYVSAMIAATPENEPVEAWQIADAHFVRRYPLGMAKPMPIPLTPYLRKGYLKRGRTIDELAQVCGIDPVGLVETVTRFNANARRGQDPDFKRGSTAFNRYGGDASAGPNPTLAPIQKGPFYAVKVVPGSFGSFAGLATDSKARVLDDNSLAIPGLYAVGCDQANVFGGHYPAGGINLGPALAFGWVAAQDLAETPAGRGG